MGAYKGKASTIKEADDKMDNGFKKGGKTDKKMMDKRPARKSGGGVFSSASGPGTPRGKASHY